MCPSPVQVSHLQPTREHKFNVPLLIWCYSLFTFFCLQQLVAILHAGLLPFGSIPNCDFPEMCWWCIWWNQPLQRICSLPHNNHHCISLCITHGSGQSSWSCSCGKIDDSLFTFRIKLIYYLTSYLQILWGSAGLVITANIIVFITILGFFVAFDNDDVDYSMW